MSDGLFKTEVEEEGEGKGKGEREHAFLHHSSQVLQESSEMRRTTGFTLSVRARLPFISLPLCLSFSLRHVRPPSVIVCHMCML